MGGFSQSVSAGGISVALMADVSGFEKGMDAAIKKTEKMMDELEAELNKPVMQKLNEGVERSAKQLDEQFSGIKQMGESLSSVGKTLTATVTLPIVGIGAAALKMGSDFEEMMKQVQAVSDTSAADMERLSDAALKMGADTKFSATEVAAAMADLAAKGLDATKILETMPGILDLAAAGNLKVADASSIATQALSQFGLSIDQSGRVADVLAKAAGETQTSVGELGRALNFAGAIAKVAGVGFEETTAALAQLSEGGRISTKAGTDLRTVIASLVAPSTKAAEAMAALGVEATDSTGKLRPLNDVFVDFREKGATAADMFTIFGREGATAASILMDKAGPALTQLTEKLNASEGASQKMAATLNTGTKPALEQLRGSLEAAGITLSKALAPSLQTFAEIATGVVNNVLVPMLKAFNDLPSPVQAVAIGMAALAAAVGPALFTIGKLIESFISLKTNLILLGEWLPKFAAQLNLSITAALGWVAALTAAAYAIYKIIEAVGALDDAQKAQKKATDLAAQGHEKLRDSLMTNKNATREQTQEVRKLYDAYKDGKITEQQYMQAMQRIAMEIGKVSAKQQQNKKSTDDVAKAAAAAAAAQAALQQNLKGTGTAAKTAQPQMAELATTTQQVTAEFKEVPYHASEVTDKTLVLTDAVGGLTAAMGENTGAAAVWGETVGQVGPVFAELPDYVSGALNGIDWQPLTDEAVERVRIVRTAFDNLQQGIHDSFRGFFNKLFDDGDWRSAITDLGKSLLSSLTESFITPLSDALSDFISSALSGLFGKDGLFGGIGSALGGIFGGKGGSGGGLGGIFSGLGGLFGKGGGLGSIFSGLAGALNPLSMIGNIMGGAGALMGSLFGYNGLFGQAEGDADVLNKHTLEMVSHLETLVHNSNDTWGYIPAINETLWTINNGLLTDMNNALGYLAFINDTLWTINNGVLNTISGYMLTIRDAAVAVRDAITREGGLTVNLYGTDPTLVAEQLGTKLRLQGGTA